jgi:hypothetical protein
MLNLIHEITAIDKLHDKVETVLEIRIKYVNWFPIFDTFYGGNVICTTVICTNAKKMQKTGLCTITLRGDVISTNKYGDRQRTRYNQKLIHWIMYYQLPRTGLCTTYGWVKAWLELAPQSVIMPSARISLRPSYKSNLC